MAEAKVILICGKIASGKTTYAKNLINIKENRAVLLSCDEMMSALFGWYSDDFDEKVKKVIEFIYNKSLDILAADVDVILDFGFWSEEQRNEAKQFYKNKRINCEMHYIDIDENIRQKNIEKRNQAVKNSETTDVFIDDNLADKCLSIFEVPAHEEIDVWHKNDWV